MALVSLYRNVLQGLFLATVLLVLLQRKWDHILPEKKQLISYDHGIIAPTKKMNNELLIPLLQYSFSYTLYSPHCLACHFLNHEKYPGKLLVICGLKSRRMRMRNAKSADGRGWSKRGLCTSIHRALPFNREAESNVAVKKLLMKLRTQDICTTVVVYDII